MLLPASQATSLGRGDAWPLDDAWLLGNAWPLDDASLLNEASLLDDDWLLNDAWILDNSWPPSEMARVLCCKISASILQEKLLVTPGGPEKLPETAAVSSGLEEVARVM